MPRSRWKAAASTSRRRWAAIERRGRQDLEPRPRRRPAQPRHAGAAATRDERLRRPRHVAGRPRRRSRACRRRAARPSSRRSDVGGARRRSTARTSVRRRRGSCPTLAARPAAARAGAGPRSAALTAPRRAEAEAEFLLAHQGTRDFEDALRARVRRRRRSRSADREVRRGRRVARASSVNAVRCPTERRSTAGSEHAACVPAGWAVTRRAGPAEDTEPARSRASSAKTPTRSDAFGVKVAADAPFTDAVLAARRRARATCSVGRRRRRAAEPAVRAAAGRPRSAGWRSAACDHGRAAGRVSLRRSRPRRDPPRRSRSCRR